MEQYVGLDVSLNFGGALLNPLFDSGNLWVYEGVIVIAVDSGAFRPIRRAIVGCRHGDSRGAPRNGQGAGVTGSACRHAGVFHALAGDRGERVLRLRRHDVAAQTFDRRDQGFPRAAQALVKGHDIRRALAASGHHCPVAAGDLVEQADIARYDQRPQDQTPVVPGLRGPCRGGGGKAERHAENGGQEAASSSAGGGDHAVRFRRRRNTASPASPAATSGRVAGSGTWEPLPAEAMVNRCAWPTSGPVVSSPFAPISTLSPDT